MSKPKRMAILNHACPKCGGVVKLGGLEKNVHDIIDIEELAPDIYAVRISYNFPAGRMEQVFVVDGKVVEAWVQEDDLWMEAIWFSFRYHIAVLCQVCFWALTQWEIII